MRSLARCSSGSSTKVVWAGGPAYWPRGTIGLCGADPDKTVFVGDSEVDIATARAADLPCISVLWGFRDRDVLERAGAQQFAADIAQLQALLG